MNTVTRIAVLVGTGWAGCFPAVAQPPRGTGTGALSLHIATNGDDTWSGRMPLPNKAKTDGPFSTLERARDEIRKLKTAGALKGGVTVLVRGGIYELPRTFRLDAADSGTPDARVAYCAYRKEKPTLLGGKRITGFTPWKGQILKADVGVQGFKGIYFRQLFFNGKRQHLARFPNFDPKNPYGGGWSYVDGKPIPMYQDIPGESHRTLHFKARDVHDWSRPQEGEVMVFPRYNWWNNLIRIAALDREKRIMTLTGDASYPIRPGDRYYVRNLSEELDAPGEWYLDRETWTLYFWPPSNARSALVSDRAATPDRRSPGRADPPVSRGAGSRDPRTTVTVYAPTLERILEMGPGVANVTFHGFTIECCEGTAVSLTNCTDCRIVGNTIRNVGGRCDWNDSGVAVSGGARNGVVGNDIHEVGSQGVSLDGGDRNTLAPAGNFADNNYIHHTGIFFKQGVGVSCVGVGNRVSHNLIHDCPRFGICWGGNDHIIEYNHIRHVNLETCDTGGIYTWQVDWTARGTEIRYNYFHDVLGYGLERGKWISPHFAWGIYLDDGTCGTKVYGNIVARAALGGAHVHGGRDNVVENNIFVEGTSRQMSYNGYVKGGHPVPMMTDTWNKFHGTPAYEKYPGYAELTRSLEDAWQMAGNRFLHNIIYYSDPKAALYQHSNLPFDKTESDYNLIWHFGLPLLCDLRQVPPEKQWEEWKKLGFEHHTVIADPLFVNPRKDDYRLKPNSPAFKLGFKPIPVEKIGPYKDPLRATWPIVEAEGAREHPLVSEQPLEGFAPNPRNTTPVVALRVTKPVVVDGVLTPGEWPEAEFLMKETPSRDPIYGEPCVAKVCHDGANLYVTVTVPISDTSKLKRGEAWGKNDGAEVCFQDIAGKKPGPVFVLHGMVSGSLESSTDAGAPGDVATKLEKAARFAAKVGDKQWTGEWSIPLDGAGITPRPGLKLAFNLGALRTETGEWVIWVGALGETWRLENAGYVVLE